jgi:hypothetical protein
MENNENKAPNEDVDVREITEEELEETMGGAGPADLQITVDPVNVYFAYGEPRMLR